MLSAWFWRGICARKRANVRKKEKKLHFSPQKLVYVVYFYYLCAIFNNCKYESDTKIYIYLWIAQRMNN